LDQHQLGGVLAELAGRLVHCRQSRLDAQRARTCCRSRGRPTYANASDGFTNAVSGQGTLVDALTAAQTSTIQTLKSLSIPVKE
jgi:hypothetical protein